MSRTQTKIAAVGTVAALGVLGAAAMASGGADSTASVGTQPALVAPEVRTVVVKKVVHRTKYVKAKAPASRPRAASTAAVAPAPPRVGYSGDDATRDDTKLTKLTSRTSGAAGGDESHGGYREESEEGGEENGED
jgi:hypothetical protein